MAELENEDISSEIINLPEGGSMLPHMNINFPAEVESKEPPLISDQDLLNSFSNIEETINKDRLELDDLLANFIDMVLNGGDATSSSKEAICNLIKTKHDSTDKMIKIAELKTRIKIKESNPFHPKFTAKQNNIINVQQRKLTAEEQKALIEENQ